jgi:hypothetical protein
MSSGLTVCGAGGEIKGHVSILLVIFWWIMLLFFRKY